MDPQTLRRRYMLQGALGGLGLGLLSAFFSPAGRAEGMVALGVKVFVVLGLTALGAWFGWLEWNARSR